MISSGEAIRCRQIGADEALDATFIEEAATMLRELVTAGAALGWVDPPSDDQVAGLLRDVVAASERGDASLVVATAGQTLAGLGYWWRYNRPTHRPHADVQKLAVAGRYQGRGIGRLLMTELISRAASIGIEILALDFRGDNDRAAALYRALGFREYGRLARFVAVRSARYDVDDGNRCCWV